MHIVLDTESFAGQYMISGGLNGGSSAMEVSAAYLANMLVLTIELIEICTMIHGVVSCLAMGGVVGMLGALMITLIATLTMAYLECTQLLVKYANGNMAAGEELILTAKINVVCTTLFSYGGSVVKPILRNTALKHLVTTFGDDVAELMLMRFTDPQQLWKCVKHLRKADFTDDAIRTLVFQMDNASFVKLSQMAAKNLPKGLLQALSPNETAVRNITNIADLSVFQNTRKSWDDIAQLLAEKGDDFIRIYRQYQDEVVDVLVECGSESIVYVDLYKQAFLDMAHVHGVAYKALYAKYGAEYGQELTEKCILYVDELFAAVETCGDDFVPYMISHGDEILTYVSTYSDDVIKGIRAHQKTYVDLLLKHTDTFVRMYKTHEGAAVTLFTTYGDDILASPELYTDEVLSYVITYGDDVVNGIRTHQKAYVDLLLKHKDIFMRMYKAHGAGAVTAFITYGDDILTSPELYTDDVLAYVITYGDDVVNGIRAHQKTYVDLLLKHKDIFVRMYKAHDEDAVTAFTTYADDILNFPEQYKDEAVKLLIEYGEDVVDGLRNHYDDFMKRYADEGVEFVKEYLEKGDEVFVDNLEVKLKDYIDDIVDASGNVNATKMNDLKNAIQRGAFSKEEISYLSRKMSDLGITEAYETAMKNIDFGEYLRNIVGGPPANMIDPHAHHILFKVGNGETQKALVKEGQEILRKYGIDPIVGPENLVWAPWRITGQHDAVALTEVVEALRVADATGGEYEDIVEALQKMGTKASQRK